MNFAQSGRTIVLLRANEVGDAVDAESEFGSSEYAKEILGAVWGYPPELDLEKEATLQRALVALIQAGLAESVHDCADGGLAVSLAECALPKGVGLSVNLKSHDLPAEFVLFGEDASRVVLSCDPANLARIQQVVRDYGLFVDLLGETGGDRVEIVLDGKRVISVTVAELRESYEGALEKALRAESGAMAAD
jgi:phosphoribosylformylglycinamidine synthase